MESSNPPLPFSPQSAAGHAEPSFESGSAQQIGTGTFFLLWGLLTIWSFVKAPIPGINEPHYFCKARHFWQPDWCGPDFFLNSSNPHAVFYAVWGWLTLFCSLEITTVIVRLAGWAVLAMGWRELTRPLLGSGARPVIALSLFLLFQACVNFSGEWLVAGVESKVFSYGFGFWALGAFQQRQPLRAAVLLGLSVSFHPLVGLWLALCLPLGWFLQWSTGRPTSKILTTLRSDLNRSLHNPRQLRHVAGAFLVWGLTSLPGFIPAVAMLLEPADAHTKYAADYLQVYYRLQHHLDPMKFHWWRYLSYAAMCIGIILCVWKSRPTHTSSPAVSLVPSWNQKTGERRFLAGVFLASLLIAATGVLLGLRWTPPADMWAFKTRLKLLKFYPFRLFDLLAPLLLALLWAERFRLRWGTRWQAETRLWGVGVMLFLVGLLIPFPDHNPSRMSPAQKRDWREACAWLKTETPLNSLVVTPNRSWAFKWFAERAEYVTFKDCPQEATGVVEWNNRLLLLKNWGQGSYQDQFYSREEMAQLAARTGANYLLTHRLGPFEQKPIFQNGFYRIYALAPATQE